MNGPRRLLEESEYEFESQLLRSAALDRGSKEALAQALTVFSTAAATGVSMAALAKSGSWLLTLKGAGALLVVGSLGAVATGIAIHAGRAVPSVSSVSASSARALSVARAKSSAPAQHVEADPATAPPVTISVTDLPVEGAEPSSPVAPTKSAKALSHGKEAAPADGSANAESCLAREVALLDHARSSLAMGNPRAALAALDTCNREVPAGLLKPESTVLRVQALLAVGDRTAAVALARDFLSHNPMGPHAVRMRHLLGGAFSDQTE